MTVDLLVWFCGTDIGMPVYNGELTEIVEEKRIY